MNLKLTSLAQKWMNLVNRNCPYDWSSFLPVLDFDSPTRNLEPRTLPVLSFLPQLANQVGGEFRELIDVMLELAPDLHFGQTYSAEDFGEAFLQQYGWIKFLGPDAYWHSDIISGGFIILGDSITYPEHWHKAEELYIPISGSAEWYHQDHGWQLKQPGSLILHQSNVKHGMRTIGEPLMALYIWCGGNLIQKSEHE